MKLMFPAKKILAIFLFLLTILFFSDFALADVNYGYKEYFKEWNDKRELATQYLKEAEEQLKAGDELSGCAAQQKASEYGVAATNSLIKAMKLNGTLDGIDDLQAGLNKWRELGDFC